MRNRQPAVTSLAQIKSVAKAFLYLDPEKTAFSPIVVKHPFTDSAFVGLKRNGAMTIGNILDSAADLELWREKVKERIDKADSISAVVASITKPYSLAFLKHIETFLSKEDLGSTLAHMWCSCEAPNRDSNLSNTKLLSMFKRAVPAALMDEDEYQLFKALPNTVRVYRGVTPMNENDRKALSWTIDPSVAQWFAHRYGEEGKVFTAKIPKEYIYAYFTGRGESEVIVNPNMLQEIAIYKGNKQCQ